MTINKETLSRLDRQFPLVHERYVFTSGSLSCDDGYVDDNLEAAVWLLDNSKLLLEVLQRYRRITEITFEGEKPSE